MFILSQQILITDDLSLKRFNFLSVKLLIIDVSCQSLLHLNFSFLKHFIFVFARLKCHIEIGRHFFIFATWLTLLYTTLV
jgi:hypothetical protein